MERPVVRNGKGTIGSHLPTLRIDCDSPVGMHAHVFLDDVEIPCDALTLRIAVDDITTVEMSMMVGKVEVSSEALAWLTAHADVPEGDGD